MVAHGPKPKENWNPDKQITTEAPQHWPVPDNGTFVSMAL